MCQLLGMNAADPTDFTFTFRGFCQRGGATDVHSHGFGLSIYEGRGVRSFLDTLPACESPLAKVIQNYPIRTYVSPLQHPYGLYLKSSEVSHIPFSLFLLPATTTEHDRSCAVCNDWVR